MVTFRIISPLGDPLDGLSPALLTCVNAVGSSIIPPRIEELGDGWYGFDADDSVTGLLCLGGSHTPPVLVTDAGEAGGPFLPTWPRPVTLTQPITVDGGTGLLSAALYVLTLRGGVIVSELVWDGSAFASLYADSTITPVSNGYRLTLARDGGWGMSL